MAFKSVEQYNEERFGSFFLLRDDGDYADVIFLYENPEDMLVAEVHYVKSPTYSGYVHCCGKGCPACEKKIRVQTKLFIPVYNIEADEIQFFDRGIRFEPQMQRDVFRHYPNPSQVVWRITRHGAAGSIDTYYTIAAVGRNSIGTYSEILAKFDATMPDYYSNVCKEFSATELRDMLNTNSEEVSGSDISSLPEFNVSPRVPISTASGSANTVVASDVMMNIPTISDKDDDDDVVF